MKQEGWAAESAPCTERLSKVWRNPPWWNLLICLPWAMGIVESVYRWDVDTETASREMAVYGIITAHDKSSHSSHRSFVVKGASYSGRDTTSHDPVVRQPVPVYYDPLRPEKNGLTDCKERRDASLAPVQLMLAGVETVTLIIFMLRRRSRKQLAAKTP